MGRQSRRKRDLREAKQGGPTRVDPPWTPFEPAYVGGKHELETADGT